AGVAPWLYAFGFTLLLVYVAYYDWRDGKVYTLPLIPLFVVAYVKQLTIGAMLPAVMSMLILGAAFLGIFLLGQIGMGDVLLNLCIGLFFSSLYQLGWYLVAMAMFGAFYVTAYYFYYTKHKDYEPKGRFGFGGFTEEIPVEELTTDMILNGGRFITFTTEDDVERLQQRGGTVRIAHRWPGVPIMLVSFILTFLAFHI
ncbi:MAG: hypothetical protein R6U10_00990, partial [Thermoplasmatota archaeon]